MSEPNKPKFYLRVSALIASIIILITVYLFQGQLLEVINRAFPDSPKVAFISSKTVRLIANDLACFVMIWALFYENKYLKIAWAVFLIELGIILPLYLILKLYFEGTSEISSPLLSQVHRLIVNPTLMLVLIFSFFVKKLQD